jgi:hypothetical protein
VVNGAFGSNVWFSFGDIRFASMVIEYEMGTFRIGKI